MKTYFPPQRQNYQFYQTNRSNLQGSLWATFNMDFQSNLGAVRIGSRLRVNTSTADSSHLGLPICFKEFDGRIWSICQQWVFKCVGTNIIISSFIEDMSSGVIATYDFDVADMEVFNGELVTTNTSHVYTKASNGSGTGAWTDRGSIVGAGGYHKLLYFKNFDRIYFASALTSVRSADTSWVVASSGDYFLQLTGEVGQISTMIATSQYIWIGNLRIYNDASSYSNIEKASVFQWDGISAQPTNAYPIDAQGILAMVLRNNIIHIMDSNGVLRKYNGTSFDEIGRLPLNKELLIGATVSGNDRFVHPNGMICTKNNTIQVLVNNLMGDSSSSIKENLASGIWEWSEENGFVHLNPFTYQGVFSSTVTDFGQNRISRAGALANANIYSTSASGRGTILAGCNYFTDASSIQSAIFIDSPIPTDNAFTPEGQKKGYFVTTWMTSSEIQDKWERLWSVYKRFSNLTDSIVFKYRLYEESPIEATITWTSTTTFTTTTDVTAYAPTATGFNGTVGGEVEIVQGTGGGSCTHITSIVNNAGTYTVTLDNPITGVTGTAKARFQKWIRLNPQSSGIIRSWDQMAIGENNTRIQIKCCLTWTGDGEFYKFAIFSNEDIKITS